MDFYRIYGAPACFGPGQELELDSAQHERRADDVIIVAQTHRGVIVRTQFEVCFNVGEVVGLPTPLKKGHAGGETTLSLVGTA